MTGQLDSIDGAIEGPTFVTPLDRLEDAAQRFTVATGKLRRVICTIRRRYPHVVRWQPRSRVYRNYNGTVRRKARG